MNDNNPCQNDGHGDHFFTETKFLVLHVVSRGKKFSHSHFLAGRATSISSFCFIQATFDRSFVFRFTRLWFVPLRIVGLVVFPKVRDCCATILFLRSSLVRLFGAVSCHMQSLLVFSNLKPDLHDQRPISPEDFETK
jgi:hypothetical protein